jgi:hypothetical protein
VNTLLRPPPGTRAMPSPAPVSPRLSPPEWDTLRLAFHGSPLVDAPLSALAQNIDGCSWPLDDAEEKPASYIDLPYGEAIARLRFYDLEPARLDTLADILRGTLAFDASFGAMAEVASGAEAAADPLGRKLARLGIPADFPVALCNLPPGTLHFCEREELHTLGAFLDFSRGASRAVIVGGEFRDLLNAVGHNDEETLARYLPYRPHARGLHLVEALGHLVRPLDIEARIALTRDPASVGPDLRARATRLIEYFPDQYARLRAAAAQGVPYARLVVSLDDLSLESAVAGLLRLYIEPAPTQCEATSQAATKPKLRWLPRWWPGRA